MGHGSHLEGLRAQLGITRHNEQGGEDVGCLPEDLLAEGGRGGQPPPLHQAAQTLGRHQLTAPRRVGHHTVQVLQQLLQVHILTRPRVL